MAPTSPQPALAWPEEQQADGVLTAPDRLAAVATAAPAVRAALADWDRLTRLACTLLGVPASFVAVVGAARDDYPSQVGLPEAVGTPAAITGRSFCHYTLALDRLVAIEDTWQQPHTRAVPTVETLGIRAYVGVPVHVDGQPIGSFCVVDTRPRRWVATELDMLAMLARAAERELALHLALTRADAEASRARALALQREALMSSVAHDLGTPLQLVQLVGWQLRQSATPAQQPLVDRLMHAGDAMRRLTRDLVREHSLSGEARVVHRLAVDELLQAAVAMMAPLAERSGIRLSVGCGVAASVQADHAEMLRVFGNLIGNALKYTPSGSAVQLQAAEGAGGQLLLTVADDGPGMSAADCARAFTPGWQGADGHAHGEGAGLGLGIVRTLVARNGGSVALHSAPGAGTRVEISLPRAG